MYQPHGFIPVAHAHAPDRERIAIDPGGGNDLYIHDPVVMNAGGKIVRAVPGGPVLGSVNSFHRPDQTPDVMYPAGETGWWAEVNCWEHQQYELVVLTVALIDPGDRGQNINFRFEAGTPLVPHSSAVLDAGSKTAADTGQLRLIKPVLRPYPYRIFPGENNMLQFDPNTRIRGRQNQPEIGEIVFRQDLNQWFYALNTNNASMADWSLCAIGESLAPITGWVVQINNHQRVTRTGI